MNKRIYEVQAELCRAVSHPKIVTACTLVKQLLADILTRERELLKPYAKRK